MPEVGCSRQDLEDEGVLDGRGCEGEGVLSRGTAYAKVRWPRSRVRPRPGEACVAGAHEARGSASRPEWGRGLTWLGGWGAWNSDSEMASHLRYAVRWKKLAKSYTM